jgi:tetratricopeptide (TPR) repeat protein
LFVMRIPASTLALLLAALPSVAQQTPQNPPPSSDQSQSQTQDQSQSPSSQSQNSSTDKSQPAPTERKRLPLGKQPSTADDNPFPEDISKKAAAAAGNSTPDAPKSSNGGDKPPASSDRAKPGAPDYSSSRTGLRDLDSTDPEARISDGAGGYIFDPKLAAKDVKVGGFYLTNSDYKGAYARYKEATKVDPTNVDAVFGLAEAARGLKLTSEAVENYRVYLDADPDGPKAKAARKALAQLGTPPRK